MRRSWLDGPLFRLPFPERTWRQRALWNRQKDPNPTVEGLGLIRPIAFRDDLWRQRNRFRFCLFHRFQHTSRSVEGPELSALGNDRLSTMEERKVKLPISIVRYRAKDGTPSVGLLVSAHAFVEVGVDLQPGVALSPRNARVIAKYLLEAADDVDEGLIA